MTMLSLGDAAYHFQLSRQNLGLKQGLDAAMSEVTTGQVTDMGARLSGDFSALAAVEHSLKTLGSYQTATSEVGLRADTMQAALETLAGTMRDLQPALLLAASQPQSALVDTAAVDAQAKLEQAIAALNASAGGQSLFSGAATDTTPMTDAATLMAALQAEVAGASSPADILTALDTWFDTPGGGFDTLAYAGADTGGGPVRVAEGQTVTLDITAADPALREVIKGLAAAALLENGDLLSGDAEARASLAAQAGEALLSADAGLVTLQARLGAAQERIETLTAKHAAQSSALELAKFQLVGVDPYDAATRLEALQAQLETLYTVTARISRLNLADFL